MKSWQIGVIVGIVMTLLATFANAH